MRCCYFTMKAPCEDRGDVPIARGTFCALPLLLFFAGNREGVADDGLEHDPVRAGGEAVADAEFNVEGIHLEIGDRIQLLALLPERKEIADFAEGGIIFEADKSTLAAIAGEPRRRRKNRFPRRAEADVDN